MRGVIRCASTAAAIALGVVLSASPAQAQEDGNGIGWAPMENPAGIGLAVSTQQISGQPSTRGFALLVRDRDVGRETELEISRHRWQGGVDRTSTRIGASWYIEQADQTWEPYLVLGFGVNLFDVAVQGYAEGGLGLALRLNPNFTLSADVRASVRRVLGRESQPPASSASKAPAPATAGVPESQRGLEFRLAAIVYL